MLKRIKPGDEEIPIKGANEAENEEATKLMKKLPDPNSSPQNFESHWRILKIKSEFQRNQFRTEVNYIEQSKAGRIQYLENKLEVLSTKIGLLLSAPSI